jgi:hypothetical protein
LTNPATQVTVSRVLFDTKINAEKRLAGKCATLLFDDRHSIDWRVQTTIVQETSVIGVSEISVSG